MIDNKEFDHMENSVGYIADCNRQSDDTLGDDHISCKTNEWCVISSDFL